MLQKLTINGEIVHALTEILDNAFLQTVLMIAKRLSRSPHMDFKFALCEGFHGLGRLKVFVFWPLA